MKSTKVFIMFVVSFFLLEDLYPDRSIPPKISIRDVPYISIFSRLNELTKDLNLNTEAYVKDLLLYEILIENLGRSTYSIHANKIGQGTFVQCSAPISGFITKIFYVISLDNEFVVSPVSGVDSEDGNSTITMLVPGMDLVRAKIITINEFQYGVFGRPTDLEGPFEIFEDSIGPRIRPVPRPNNEKTANLRGAVGIGDTLELVKLRLEEYEKGVQAHPPADATWSHVWKVGNGLLAIEKDEETDSVLKMGYILWPENETPVTIELSRIYLNDGEMVMPIPPPPPWTEERQQELKQQEEAQRNLRQTHLNPFVNKEQAAENKERSEAFLAENAKREDITVTPSGLQYQVIEAGEGAKPTATDIVTVHYIGRFIDGTVFDSSRQRGEPAHLPLDRVIPGWAEGVQLMSPGAKYRFWIPSHLAYGPNAAPTIGPNQVLDFEVELIDIK